MSDTLKYTAYPLQVTPVNVTAIYFIFYQNQCHFVSHRIKLSVTIKNGFANFTKIRKKCFAKVSKRIANRVSRTVNSNPVNIC